MGKYSCLGNDVDCYSVDRIKIGAYAVVSQYSFLCTASHDYENPQMPLVTAPIAIEDDAWVCADFFVGPGVTIGQGVVVSARSSVYKNVDPWVIMGGNPAKFIKERKMKETCAGT